MTTLIKSNGRVFPEFPSLFDDFLTKDWFETPAFRKAAGANVPSVNIKENDAVYEMELAIPGLDKKDIHVEVNNHTLTVAAVVEKKTEEEKNNYTRREFSYTNFKRVFNLPHELVDLDKISAKSEHGVLTITIPKRQEKRDEEKKLIEVQ